MDKATRTLVADLSPERDYGDRSYDEIIEGIESGDIAISPGADAPMLRDLAGHTLKGSGVPVARTRDLSTAVARLRSNESNRDWFDALLLAEHPSFPGKPLRDALMDEAMERIRERGRDSIKLLMEIIGQHIGKPKETGGGNLTILAGRIINLLGEEVPMTIEGDYRKLDD